MDEKPIERINGPDDDSTTWYLWVENIRPRTLRAVMQEYTSLTQRVMLVEPSQIPTERGSAVCVQPCTRHELLALIKRVLADRRLSGFGDVWFKSQRTIDHEMRSEPFKSRLGRFLGWARGF